MDIKKIFMPVAISIVIASLSFSSVACNQENDQRKTFAADVEEEELIVPGMSTFVPNIPLDPDGKYIFCPEVPDSQLEFFPSPINKTSSIWQYINDEKAEALIITFWATWNLPSKKELAYLETLLREYKQQGLRVLAISIDNDDGFTKAKMAEILSDDQDMEQTLKELGKYPKIDGKYLSYPIALDNSKKILEAIGVTSIPYTLLVTKNHKIYFRQYGFDEDKFKILEEKTDDLLKHMKQDLYQISGTKAYFWCMVN